MGNAYESEMEDIIRTQKGCSCTKIGNVKSISNNKDTFDWDLMIKRVGNGFIVACNDIDKLSYEVFENTNENERGESLENIKNVLYKVMEEGLFYYGKKHDCKRIFIEIRKQ